MPRYIAILLALPLLLSCEESQEAKLLAQKKAEEIELDNARKAEALELENAKKAQAEFEAKLKTEYEKKFGVPISDFELSITSVIYLSQISVTRTTTGASAKYIDNELEIEIDVGEWLDFVNALYKCNIKDWIKENDSIIRWHKKMVSDYQWDLKWDLEILLSSSEELKLTGTKYKPSANWSKFMKVAEDLQAKIIKEGNAKLEAKLKYEYEKRFGIPISDFELSISHIDFRYSRKPLSDLKMNATRTVNGARIRYYVDYEQRNTTGFYDDSRFGFYVELNLDIGEWLDFVNALNKCNVGKWEKDYSDKNLGYYKRWNLGIYYLGKAMLISRSSNGVPSNWDEFIKIIESFGVKAREKAVEKTDSIRKAKLKAK